MQRATDTVGRLSWQLGMHKKAVYVTPAEVPTTQLNFVISDTHTHTTGMSSISHTTSITNIQKVRGVE